MPQITKQVLNDTTKALETESELMAIYHLGKKGYDDRQIFSILSKINYYPSVGVTDKARRMINVEKGALKELNSFFSRI